MHTLLITHVNVGIFFSLFSAFFRYEVFFLERTERKRIRAILFRSICPITLRQFRAIKINTISFFLWIQHKLSNVQEGGKKTMEEIYRMVDESLRFDLGNRTQNECCS